MTAEEPVVSAEELNEIRRDMDHLLESMEVGTLFLDADLRIRKLTPLVESLFCVTPQDVGRSILDSSSPITDPELLDDIRAVLGGTEQHIDRHVGMPGGRRYLLRVRPYLVDSDVQGVVLAAIDVAALRDAEERISQGLAFRDEFIAMLSHELRNPLAAIVSAVELAKVDGGTALDVRVLDIVSRQSLQMSRVLEGLLDLSPATDQGADSTHSRTRVDSFILVVEDDVDNRELLTTVLERRGYAVRSAGDGAAALAILESERPGMAIIDIGLPEPEGYELARIARGLHPGIALVALTGYGTAHDRTEAQESGFDEHLVKPVDFDTLHAVVDRFMRRRRRRD